MLLQERQRAGCAAAYCQNEQQTYPRRSDHLPLRVGFNNRNSEDERARDRPSRRPATGTAFHFTIPDIYNSRGTGRIARFFFQQRSEPPPFGPNREKTLSTDANAARTRAEANFRKEERAKDGAKAMMEYQANGKIVRDKMAKLKALRLAKEATDKK